MLGAAIVVVTALRRAGVPSIAGFILTGALIGPTALALVDDTHHVEVLAEIGIVLLLFGIGMELSLDRLRRFWKAVILGGGIQVTLTVACTAAAATWFGLATGPAIFLGCVVAISSTAVVLRGLSTRGELEAPHGRLAVGILVFQDFVRDPHDSGRAYYGRRQRIRPGNPADGRHRTGHSRRRADGGADTWSRRFWPSWPKQGSGIFLFWPYSSCVTTTPPPQALFSFFHRPSAEPLYAHPPLTHPSLYETTAVRKASVGDCLITRIVMQSPSRWSSCALEVEPSRACVRGRR